MGDVSVLNVRGIKTEKIARRPGVMIPHDGGNMNSNVNNYLFDVGAGKNTTTSGDGRGVLPVQQRAGIGRMEDGALDVAPRAPQGHLMVDGPGWRPRTSGNPRDTRLTKKCNLSPFTCVRSQYDNEGGRSPSISHMKLKRAWPGTFGAGCARRFSTCISSRPGWARPGRAVPAAFTQTLHKHLFANQVKNVLFFERALRAAVFPPGQAHEGIGPVSVVGSLLGSFREPGHL